MYTPQDVFDGYEDKIKRMAADIKQLQGDNAKLRAEIIALEGVAEIMDCGHERRFSTLQIGSTGNESTCVLCENERLKASEEYQDIDRSMAAELEQYAFVVEDETGLLSDTMLTPEKLSEILHTLKAQRDYAAETASMNAKEAERLCKVIEWLRKAYGVRYACANCQANILDGVSVSIGEDDAGLEIVFCEKCNEALKGGE